MKLKNILIVVNDVEKSKVFYKDLFGLDVVVEQGGNTVLTEGLVLQDAGIWRHTLDSEIVFANNASELPTMLPSCILKRGIWSGLQNGWRLMARESDMQNG